MDSVTQIALGAAVGHAAGARVLGRRALLWGAALGTLPDLDSFYPFADPVSAFTYHRGISHSLFFLTLLAPVLAAIGIWLHRIQPRLRRRWLLVVWLCLVTHPLLDACTVYGTQLLLPFTDHPFGSGAIFIIDPVYTLPLIAGVVAAALPLGDRALALRVNYLGLAASTVYLVACMATQQAVADAARRQLAGQGIEAERLLAQPTPFNSVLWRVLARVEGGYYEGYHSLLDPAPRFAFGFHRSEDAALAAVAAHPAARRLTWFSKGFYGVRRVPGGVVISDLRMGLEPAYVFSFLVPAGSQDPAAARRLASPRLNGEGLALLIARARDPAVALNGATLAAAAGLGRCGGAGEAGERGRSAAIGAAGC